MELILRGSSEQIAKVLKLLANDANSSAFLELLSEKEIISTSLESKLIPQSKTTPKTEIKTEAVLTKQMEFLSKISSKTVYLAYILNVYGEEREGEKILNRFALTEKHGFTHSELKLFITSARELADKLKLPLFIDIKRYDKAYCVLGKEFYDSVEIFVSEDKKYKKWMKLNNLAV